MFKVNEKNNVALDSEHYDGETNEIEAPANKWR